MVLSIPDKDKDWSELLESEDFPNAITRQVNENHCLVYASGSALKFRNILGRWVFEDYSEQHILDQSPWSFVLGAPPKKYFSLLDRRSITTCVHYPRTLNSNGDLEKGIFDPSKVREPCIAVEWKHVRGILDMIKALDVCPVVGGIHVTDAFKCVAKDEVFEEEYKSETPNHAILIVGYHIKDGSGYWIIQNSWGEDWGTGGFCRIKMGSNVGGIEDLAFMPVVSPRLEVVDFGAHEEPMNPSVEDIEKLCKDDTWSVRYRVANQICKHCEVVGAEITKTRLLPVFLELLVDPKDEVRALAAGKLVEFCYHLESRSIIEQILPCVKNQLFYDSSHHVRSALSSAIMGLAPILGKENTINRLFPIFSSCLEDDNCPDVRLNVISKLDEVKKVVGDSLLYSTLLPTFERIGKDNVMCMKIIEHIPLLASKLGRGFFKVELFDLCKQWLVHEDRTIRMAGENIMKWLAKEFGTDWAMRNIVPLVLKMRDNPDYKYHITMLCTICLLAPVLGSDITISEFLPVVIEASQHSRSEVKRVVVRLLKSVVPVVAGSDVVKELIRQTLLVLSDDPDNSVSKISKKLLESIDLN